MKMQIRRLLLSQCQSTLIWKQIVKMIYSSWSNEWNCLTVVPWGQLLLRIYLSCRSDDHSTKSLFQNGWHSWSEFSCNVTKKKPFLCELFLGRQEAEIREIYVQLLGDNMVQALSKLKPYCFHTPYLYLTYPSRLLIWVLAIASGR